MMNEPDLQFGPTSDGSSAAGISEASTVYDYIMDHIGREYRRTLHRNNFSVRIADRAAKLVFTGPETRSYFTAAFSHVRHDAGKDFALTVFCVETGKKFMQRAFALLPGGYFSGNERDTPFLTQDGITIAPGREGAALSMLNMPERIAAYLFADLAELTYYEQGSPFRNIFQWWFDGKDSTMLHSGAVSLDGRALLISGPGGSGKSTIALACLLNGMDYLGDDYVVVANNKNITVSSLYSTVKLTGDAIRRFPAVRKWTTNPGFSRNEKEVIFLDVAAPGKIIAESSLQGIIIPEISGAPGSSWRRISAAEAFRALAPSTIFQHVGRRHSIAGFTAMLARSLPCFKLAAGSDTGRMAETMQALFSEI